MYAEKKILITIQRCKNKIEVQWVLFSFKLFTKKEKKYIIKIVIYKNIWGMKWKRLAEVSVFS